MLPLATTTLRPCFDCNSGLSKLLLRHGSELEVCEKPASLVYAEIRQDTILIRDDLDQDVACAYVTMEDPKFNQDLVC